MKNSCNDTGAVNFGSITTQELCDEIKRRITIAALWRKLDLPNAPYGETGAFCSPLRDDREKSFSICYDGRGFKDHGCEEHKGTVIDFYMIAKGVNVATAVKELKVLTGIVDGEVTQRPNRVIERKAEPKAEKPEALSKEQLEDCVNWYCKVITDPAPFAAWRNWKQDTIKGLAQEGAIGQTERGKLAFIYPCGVKSRDGKRRAVEDNTRWEFKVEGEQPLWRINLAHSGHTRFIITEGEPDAITLIDAGFESDGQTLVLARGNATASLRPYLKVFRGKTVVLVADNDKLKPEDEATGLGTWKTSAGAKSLRARTKELRNVAAQILWWVPAASVEHDIKDVTELRDTLGSLDTTAIEKEFVRVDDIEANFVRYVQRKYNRNLNEEQAEDGSVAQIEGDAVAELYGKLGRIRCVGEDWYIETNGIWLPTNREQYRPIALRMLPASQRTHDRGAKVLRRLEDEVQTNREQFCGAARFDSNGSVFLAVKNGVLRLKEDAEIELIKPNAAYGFTAQLPVAWNPDAISPLFDTTLMQSLPDQQDRAHLIDVLATALIPDARYEIALVLQGEAGTGKSTVMAPIFAIFGETCSSLSLSDLCHPNGYKLSMLHNRLINLATELNTLEVDDTGLFKQLVSGERFTARPIYGRPFEMSSHATLVFLANDLPRFKNGTDAEMRRLRFVKFNQKPDKIDVTLKERLMLEAEGVFATLVRHAHDLLSGAQITPQGKYGQQVSQRFGVSNDPVGQFIAQYCERGADCYCAKNDLYEAFTEFRDAHGISDKFEANAFFRRLYDRYQDIHDGKQRRVDGTRRRVITGISLKRDNE
jgi:P4 family phage/plasmid primase-like protien